MLRVSSWLQNGDVSILWLTLRAQLCISQLLYSCPEFNVFGFSIGGRVWMWYPKLDQKSWWKSWWKWWEVKIRKGFFAVHDLRQTQISYCWQFLVHEIHDMPIWWVKTPSFIGDLRPGWSLGSRCVQWSQWPETCAAQQHDRFALRTYGCDML